MPLAEKTYFHMEWCQGAQKTLDMQPLALQIPGLQQDSERGQ